MASEWLGGRQGCALANAELSLRRAPTTHYLALLLPRSEPRRAVQGPRPSLRRRGAAARRRPQKPRAAATLIPSLPTRPTPLPAALKRYVIVRDIPDIAQKNQQELGTISGASCSALSKAGLGRVQWQHSYVADGALRPGILLPCSLRAVPSLHQHHAHMAQRGEAGPGLARARAATPPLTAQSSPACCILLQARRSASTWQPTRTRSGSTPASAGERNGLAWMHGACLPTLPELAPRPRPHRRALPLP